MPCSLRMSFISSRVFPQRNAILSSLNPMRLAFCRFSADRLSFIVSSISMMFWIFRMKNGSIFVILDISSIGIPFRSAWYITNKRSCVGWRRISRSSSSFHSLKPKYMSTSSERTAFCIASSIVLPIAITSPVLFIAVVRCLSAVTNLSKGQRGILTTV